MFVRLLEWRGSAWVWAAVVLALAGYAGYWWHVTPAPVDSDLLGLLPEQELPEAVRLAQARLVGAAERRVVILVGSSDPTEAVRAADASAAVLGRAAVFSRMVYPVDGAALEKWRGFFAPYRQGLVGDAERELLEVGKVAEGVRRALPWFYSPIGFPGGLTLRDDPLQFFGQWQMERAQLNRLAIVRDRLVVRAAGRTYVAALLETGGSAFAQETQLQVVAALEEARAAALGAAPGAEALAAGIVLHAAAAARQAQGEMSLVGIGSLVGMIVLMLLSFRSIGPLLLAQLPVLVGCLAGVAVGGLVFGRLHLMTLVFGATLLGVAVDYGLHYLCHVRVGDGRSLRFARLHAIGAGMGLAWVTTVLAYVVLAVPPFPALRQMAVYSVAGLLAAWLTVLIWLPRLARSGLCREAGFVRFLDDLYRRWPRVRTRSSVLWVTGLALATVLPGLLRLTADDDIRLLQGSPPGLLAEQERVSQLVGAPSPARLLVVQAPTPQGVLEMEERLRGELDRLRVRGLIEGYQALSLWVPSAARQERDYALLTRRAYGSGGWLDELGRILGLPAAWLEASRRAHQAAAGVTLPLEAWLASPVSEPFRHLWIGRTADGYASVITLTGIRGAAGIEALRAAARDAPPVLWVDRVEALSSLLGRHRRDMTILLGCGYLLVLGALVFRFRRATWRVGVPTGLATAATLAAYGWAGRPLNLFTILSLFLVLGIGIDYSIYLQEEQGDRTRAWSAVSLSALTTLLSFGLLAFSRAVPLYTFGLTVLLGVGLSWLLAPSFASAAKLDVAVNRPSRRDDPSTVQEEVP